MPDIFIPYRWKGVMVHFGDASLTQAKMKQLDYERIMSYAFDEKRVIGIGHLRAFGRKPADNLSLKMVDASGDVTIEPAEQVFYRAYISGRDKEARLLLWLYASFGDVTLAENGDDCAAADEEQEDVNVTIDKCLNCGIDLAKRGGAKTCSPKCRKALSRKMKASQHTVATT